MPWTPIRGPARFALSCRSRFTDVLNFLKDSGALVRKRPQTDRDATAFATMVQVNQPEKCKTGCTTTELND